MENGKKWKTENGKWKIWRNEKQLLFYYSLFIFLFIFHFPFSVFH